MAIFTPWAAHAQAPSHPEPGSCRDEQGTERCKGYRQEWVVIRERRLPCILVSHPIALKFPVPHIFTTVRINYRPCNLSVIITSVWREAKRKSAPGNTCVVTATMVLFRQQPGKNLVKMGGRSGNNGVQDKKIMCFLGGKFLLSQYNLFHKEKKPSNANWNKQAGIAWNAQH